MKGRVVSTKTKNTATVLVERQAVHPLYKKAFVRSKKYLVDDQLGVKMGDIVEIINSRPVSKNKHWKVVKVLGRSMTEIAEEKMKQEAEEVIAEVMPEEKEDQIKSEDQKVSKSENKKKQSGSTDSTDTPISSGKPKRERSKKRETK